MNRLVLRNLLLLLLSAFSSQSSIANVTGNGPQNFNTAPDGLGFLTVQSSETLRPGFFNLGLFVNYASNSLPYLQSTSQGNARFSNSLFGMDLNIAYGILPNWEVALSAPFILGQILDNTDTLHGEFEKNGNTEIRASTKYRLLGDENSGLALVGTVSFDRTINNPYRGINPGPATTLEIAADRKFGEVRIGLNVGYRLMSPGTQVPTSPVAPIGNQFISSVAASYLIPGTSTKLISEIFGGFPVQSTVSELNRLSTSLEFLIGAKRDLSQNLAIQAGAGTGLIRGMASPDLRLYAGLNFAFGPVFRSASFEKPDSPASETHSKEEKFITRNITFEYDSTQMTGDYVNVLAEFVNYLNQPPVFKTVVVAGYTDSIGNAEYNQKLSQRRAQAIKDYLVQVHKISAAQITAEGHGPADPVADNGNFQGRFLNRRVEFKIQR